MRVSSTFVAGEPPYFSKFSSSSLRFIAPAKFQPSHANLRTFVTYAIASKPMTKTKKSTPPPRGITKPRSVSSEMMDFLGGRAEISWTLVLKEIWAYTKEKELQLQLKTMDICLAIVPPLKRVPHVLAEYLFRELITRGMQYSSAAAKPSHWLNLKGRRHVDGGTTAFEEECSSSTVEI